MQQDLSQVFKRCAEEEFYNSSPLYAELSLAIAGIRRCCLWLLTAEPESGFPTCFSRLCTFCFLLARNIHCLSGIGAFLALVCPTKIYIPVFDLFAWRIRKKCVS